MTAEDVEINDCRRS